MLVDTSSCNISTGQFFTTLNLQQYTDVIHSAKFKTILSIVSLGKRAIKKMVKMTKRQFHSAMRALLKIAGSAMEPGC